jgi:hypothetical protein
MGRAEAMPARASAATARTRTSASRRGRAVATPTSSPATRLTRQHPLDPASPVALRPRVTPGLPLSAGSASRAGTALAVCPTRYVTVARLCTFQAVPWAGRTLGPPTGTTVTRSGRDVYGWRRRGASPCVIRGLGYHTPFFVHGVSGSRRAASRRSGGWVPDVGRAGASLRWSGACWRTTRTAACIAAPGFTLGCPRQAPISASFCRRTGGNLGSRIAPGTSNDVTTRGPSACGRLARGIARHTMAA